LEELDVRVDVSGQNEFTRARNLFPSVAASCLPIATRSILSPLITMVAFGRTLPSAGLITVAPIKETFSA